MKCVSIGHGRVKEEMLCENLIQVDKRKLNYLLLNYDYETKTMNAQWQEERKIKSEIEFTFRNYKMERRNEGKSKHHVQKSLRNKEK